MTKTEEVVKKKTRIDEVELCLNLAKNTRPEAIEGKTYLEISKFLNKNYGISSDEDDIFLLHEPTIETLEEDLRLQFEAIGLYY